MFSIPFSSPFSITPCRWGWPRGALPHLFMWEWKHIERVVNYVHTFLWVTDYWRLIIALGVVAKWSKVLTAVPWPLMVWSTLALGTYQFKFVSWVFHVIFSFVHFISLYTLGGLHAFRKPLPYNIYLFNLRMANYILIKI